MKQASRYRWFLLIFCAFTNALGIAAPTMCLPVLFNEISADLHLSLVQLGFVWGISAFPSVIAYLAGGVLGDRFGPKKVLIFSCLLTGLACGLRGFSNSLAFLTAAMCLFGLFSPFISINTMKTCSAWFPSRQLGLASGVLSMGMAMGFLSSSMFSATVLSPALGGWRHVLFLYGGIAILLAIPWIFMRLAPVEPAKKLESAQKPVGLCQGLKYVARIPNVWWLGLAVLGVGGCVQGVLGYLPLYLRGIGWSGVSADGALTAFHTVSMISVVPIALGSDRLGSRKIVLISAGLLIAVGAGLLSVASGVLIWVGVCVAGMVRDGFMAVLMTQVIESEGVGAAYAGTATGLTMMLSGVGSLLAPPIGNSLAAFGSGKPFIFWSALAVAGVVGGLAVRERAAKFNVRAGQS